MLILSVAAFAQAQTSQESKPWYRVPPPAWGEPSHGWQLAVFAEKQRFFTGEAVNVALVGQNGNATAMGVFINQSNWYIADFEIRRLDDGKVMTQRPPKDMTERLRRASGSSRERRVAPGATTVIGVVDLMMYDLTPGTYSVCAKFQFVDPSTKARVPVRSNQTIVSLVAK